MLIIQGAWFDVYVYLDSGRVLEKKPVNQMECEVHYISTKTN